MLTDEEIRKIKAESNRLAETWPLGGLQERDLIAKWRRDRPKMAAELAEKDALVPFAHLTVHRAYDTEKKYLDAGLPPTDAREMAAADWLLQTPESEEEEEDSGDSSHDQPLFYPIVGEGAQNDAEPEWPAAIDSEAVVSSDRGHVKDVGEAAAGMDASGRSRATISVLAEAAIDLDNGGSGSDRAGVDPIRRLKAQPWGQGALIRKSSDVVLRVILSATALMASLGAVILAIWSASAR
jgi:hypothetical protein